MESYWGDLEEGEGLVQVIEDCLHRYALAPFASFRIVTSSNLNDQVINVTCSVHNITCMLTELRIPHALLRTVFDFARKMNPFTGKGYECVFE